MRQFYFLRNVSIFSLLLGNHNWYRRIKRKGYLTKSKIPWQSESFLYAFRHIIRWLCCVRKKIADIYDNSEHFRQDLQNWMHLDFLREKSVPMEDQTIAVIILYLFFLSITASFFMKIRNIIDGKGYN